MNCRSPARADVVGSLLRPVELRTAVDAFYGEGHRAVQSEERENDRVDLRAIEDLAVRDVVRRQIEVGLDVWTPRRRSASNG